MSEKGGSSTLSFLKLEAKKFSMFRRQPCTTLRGFLGLEVEPKGRPSGMDRSAVSTVDSGVEITGDRTGVKNNALIKDIQSD